MRRKLVLLVLIIVTFLLQSTVFQNLAIASISPNLFIILTVSFALMCGKEVGMFTGFFCGLSIDLFYGTYFGFHTLLFLWIGFANGHLYNRFFDDDIKVPVVLVTISDLVYGIIMYLLMFLFRGRVHFTAYMFKVMFPEMVYTVVITLFVYKLLYKLNKKLTEYEREGQRSPWLRR